MKYRLKQLRIEFEGCSQNTVIAYGIILRVLTIRHYTLYKYRNSYQYPVDEATMYRLCESVYTINGGWVGINDEYLSKEDLDFYNKIKEVEFGEKGVEIRILRRALEDLMIKIKEDYGVSHSV